MDSQIPSPSTQPPLPPHSSKLFLIVGFIVLLGIVGVGCYVLGIKKGANDQRATDVGKTLPPPNPTPTPDETADWKTYEGETMYTRYSEEDHSFFTIKYPPQWQLDGSTLYPRRKIEDKGLESRIELGAGGHGAPDPTAVLTLPAGKANYWHIPNQQNTLSLIASIQKPNISYILEGQNLTTEDDVLFKKMLQTWYIYPRDYNPMASWKTHSTQDYTFKYPDAWSVSTSDYLNSATISSPSKVITITISEGIWPFGFGGDVKQTTEDTRLIIDGEQYDVKEITINGEIFTMTQVKSPKKHNILVGTITGSKKPSPGKTAIEEYKELKPVLLQILSTFKFTQ